MGVHVKLAAGFILAIIGITTGGSLAGALAHAADMAPLLPALVGCIAGGIALPAAFARRLPDVAMSRRMTIVWGIAAVLALANTTRITLFMADPSASWASAFPMMPESATHQCLAAYVRAGELAAIGHDDLWNPRDYDKGKVTQITGMAPYMTDPYEYPPVLAAGARTAVAATDDYQLIRVGVFGASSLAFWLAFLALALWASSTTALLCAAPMALSMPLIFCLQWGQAHVVVLAAAVAGMMLFERGRRVAGAALLAVAIATKIFPGLLLVYLAMRRRWADLAATLVALAVLAALAAAILGPATWHAYVTHQLPAMASGSAFSYVEGNPDNYAPYGLAWKIEILGFHGSRAVASTLAWIWGAVALVLTALASRKPRDRAGEAVLWLAILCLATLRSPFAPQYTGVGTLWLLAVARGLVPRHLGWFIAAWVLLQGFPPVGGNTIATALSLPSQAITIAVAILAVRPLRD